MKIRISAGVDREYDIWCLHFFSGTGLPNRSFFGVALGCWQSLDVPSAYCQCWGLWGLDWCMVKPSLGLAQCASPLNLGLVLYIYRAQLSRWVSLVGANMRSSYIIAIYCPHRRLSPHRDASSNPYVMAYQFKADTGKPSVPAWEFNLVECRNLTGHAGRGGRRAPALPNYPASKAHCTAAPRALAHWAT